MQKRFSWREFGLLMAPVAAVSALALWASTRPAPVRDDGKVFLYFYTQKPTTQEAFQGYDTAFVLQARNRVGQARQMDKVEPTLQLQTPYGLAVSHMDRGFSGFWIKVWGTSFAHRDDHRILLKLHNVPPGKLRFDFRAVALPPQNPPAMTPLPVTLPRPVSGSWKIDHTQIKAPNLSALPRKPLVKVRSVTVTQVSPGNTKAGVPYSVEAEIVFDLQSGAMGEKTPFDFDVHEHHFVPANQGFYGMSWSAGPSINPFRPVTKETPRTRIRSWKVFNDFPLVKMNVSGRASADNRWPLGFQIEPFDFRSVKVGQKLKFKAFPVALPKP